jgi:acetyl esterase/lipase/ubiquinone/menaquinone biosynthesis C-methylase UbiE
MTILNLPSTVLLLLLTITLPSITVAAEPDRAAQAAGTDFVALFNGANLDGWVVLGGSARYAVDDGSLVGTTVAGSPNTFLCTARDYANFELLFEVQCDRQLNSGVQIRSHLYRQDTPQASRPSRIRQAGEVYGYQCEIAPGGRSSGNFWDEGRHTRWHDDFAARPDAQGAFRDGEWNQFRILAEGSRIRSWVNGIACADFEDDEDASGFIGLQVHRIPRGSGPFRVRWRNIRLRELSINPGINDNFEMPDVEQFRQRFERESREIYDRRQQIVGALRLKPGMAVADIGAGTGLFTRLFARAVGEGGKVFAVDVADSFVKHVQRSCQAEGMNQVQGIVCSPSDSRLPERSVDLAFICDTYHHFEFPYQTMQSIHRALRPGGRVVLVDFVRKAGFSSSFVMGHVRADQAQFCREIEQGGFRRMGEADLLTENYFVTFQKSEPIRAGNLRSGPPIRRVTDIAYRPGNDAWKLDLYVPPASFPRPRPGIVFVHGGGWRGGDKARGQWQSYPEHFARLGYVAVSVNYRLTDQSPFPGCVEDVKCAVRWFRAHGPHLGLAPDRIGAYGNSAGAHLVSMLGLAGPEAELEGDGPYQDQSSLVQAVCASATPTDFLHWQESIQDHRALGPLLAGPEESLEQRARRASPITYVHRQAPPFFLVHGSKDTTVDVSQADRLVEGLRQVGAREVQYQRYDSAGHNVFGRHQNETLPAMEAFFTQYLGLNSPE